MTNLLSPKLIVGISIFLLISLLYLTGQFEFQMPKIDSINMNPFQFKKAEPQKEQSVYSKDEILRNSKSYEQNLQIIRGLDSSYEQRLQEPKGLIESADCPTLKEYYIKNTGWELRPYTAYKILEKNCRIDEP